MKTRLIDLRTNVILGTLWSLEVIYRSHSTRVETQSLAE